MFFGSSLFFWVIAALGTLILPWHMQQDGVSLATLIGLGAEDAEASSAFWQALHFGRFWFWPVIVALALALPGALPFANARVRGRMLIFDGLHGEARTIGLQRDPGCPVCGALATDAASA
ncbi:MAG: hypothetical protein ACKOC9_06300 [Alphaproteobacteria bacterium]